MTKVAISYNSLGLAFKGIGLVTSNLMLAVAPSLNHPGEVYVIDELDGGSSTFIGAKLSTPTGGIDILGFPTSLEGKVLSFKAPGEISFSANNDNRIEIEVMENDGQMTSLFKYARYEKGVRIFSPGDIAVEGIARVRYGHGMKQRLLEYLFGQSFEQLQKAA